MGMANASARGWGAGAEPIVQAAQGVFGEGEVFGGPFGRRVGIARDHRVGQ